MKNTDHDTDDSTCPDSTLMNSRWMDDLRKKEIPSDKVSYPSKRRKYGRKKKDRIGVRK